LLYSYLFCEVGSSLCCPLSFLLQVSITLDLLGTTEPRITITFQIAAALIKNTNGTSINSSMAQGDYIDKSSSNIVAY
jgi:hypothetical protein